jgi:hypothetical protein
VIIEFKLGGQKYVAENIFFKLCIDLNGIYGDDEYARKVCK